MSSDTERLPLASFDALSAWQDALLNLFWIVDELAKRDEDIPAEILAQWVRAEAARRKL